MGTILGSSCNEGRTTVLQLKLQLLQQSGGRG